MLSTATIVRSKSALLFCSQLISNCWSWLQSIRFLVSLAQWAQNCVAAISLGTGLSPVSTLIQHTPFPHHTDTNTTSPSLASPPSLILSCKLVIHTNKKKNYFEILKKFCSLYSMNSHRVSAVVHVTSLCLLQLWTMCLLKVFIGDVSKEGVSRAQSPIGLSGIKTPACLLSLWFLNWS